MLEIIDSKVGGRFHVESEKGMIASFTSREDSELFVQTKEAEATWFSDNPPFSGRIPSPTLRLALHENGTIDILDYDVLSAWCDKHNNELIISLHDRIKPDVVIEK